MKNDSNFSKENRGNNLASHKSWLWIIAEDERIPSGISLAKPGCLDLPVEWLTEEDYHMSFFFRNILLNQYFNF